MKKFIERLKVCWYVLTLHNFLFFGYKSDKKMLIENEQGEICGVKDKSIHGFYNIDDVTYEGNITSLRQLICENVIHVVNRIKSYEIWLREIIFLEKTDGTLL